MKRRGIKLAALAVMLGILPLFAASSEKPSESLAWRRDKTADAAIDGMPLAKLLSKLAAESGWKILIEPGLNETVSVQFRSASHAEALRLLLGKLSYALVPEPGGGARLLVYRTNMRDATRLVAADAESRPKNWLEKELILSLAPGSKIDVEDLAAELGGKVVAEANSINAYRLEFPDAETAQNARERIATRDDAAYHDNYEFERPSVASAGAPSAEAMFPIDPKPVNSGDQIKVALVDTAIQPMDGKMGGFMLEPIHIKDRPTGLPSEPTHATSMFQNMMQSMGSSAGCAEDLGNIRVQPIDIYGSSTSTTTFEVAQGLHRAINSGAQVINLSLGGTGSSPMVDYLLEAAAKKQILVFASAGNSPTTDPTYPAANPYAIAVTATDRQGKIAPYANRGSFVDVAAPGSGRVFYNGQAYISTGTSTATAFMSGQAAALFGCGHPAGHVTRMLLHQYGMPRR